MTSGVGGALEMRLIVTVSDYGDALRFYRDALGLRELGTFDDGGEREGRDRFARGRRRSTSRTAGGDAVEVAQLQT